MSPKDGSEPLSTLTHARLRVAQGDVAGARRILERILERSPADPEALRLFDSLLGRESAAHPEPDDETLPPPTPGEMDRIAAFLRGEAPPSSRERRLRRLQGWLESVQRNRERSHAR